ncbi:uncharacterized protein [Mytilus edulis]|uniref:uncharacterized protein n=1 Tax=Mytilus edulis TaxID=6550 RepID=UPI0039EE9B6C
MLSMEIKVKSELITPLTVDTDYEYDLDMTMFPGINDPIARLQPTLLIHTRGGCVCKQDSYADLQELIESCTDLECSETDSFIDEFLNDSDEENSVYSTTPSNTDDDFSNCSTSLSIDDEYLYDGIAPITDLFTPDITTSLRNAEKKTPERTTLYHAIQKRGIKRKLFSDEENNPPSKRKQAFTCDDSDLFSVLDGLFNHN